MLGKYIYLESDNHIVYNAYKESRGGQKEKVSVITDEDIEIEDQNNYYMPDKNDYMMSLKEYEQLHVHNSNKDVQDIIAATDYLRDYMKNK